MLYISAATRYMAISLFAEQIGIELTAGNGNGNGNGNYGSGLPWLFLGTHFYYLSVARGPQQGWNLGGHHWNLMQLKKSEIDLKSEISNHIISSIFFRKITKNKLKITWICHLQASVIVHGAAQLPKINGQLLMCVTCTHVPHAFARNNQFKKLQTNIDTYSRGH